MSWVGPPTGCQALLDVALWDVAAKRAGLPLYKLLGAQRETLPAYASVMHSIPSLRTSRWPTAFAATACRR